MEFQISGMTCDGCARSVQKVIEKVPGVAKAEVSLGKNMAIVSTDSIVQSAEVIQAVRNAGYDAKQVKARVPVARLLETLSLGA